MGATVDSEYNVVYQLRDVNSETRSVVRPLPTDRKKERGLMTSAELTVNMGDELFAGCRAL